MRIVLSVALGLTSAFLFVRQASAQQTQDRDGQSSGLQGFVSAGVGLVPEYEGSKYYRTTPYFDLRLGYHGYVVRFEGGALRVNLTDFDHLRIGPLIGFRRGRGDTSNLAVRRMRHIKDSATAGAFIEYDNPHEDPRAAERVTLSANDDITSNDSGWVVTLRGVVRRPVNFVNRGLIASLAVDTEWASQNYMQTYFDVTVPDAVRSGLPVYYSGAGFKSVGAAFALDQFLSRTWSVGVRFHYARLLRDAADSPLTAIAGSPDQYFVGVVAGYVL